MGVQSSLGWGWLGELSAKVSFWSRCLAAAGVVILLGQLTCCARGWAGELVHSRDFPVLAHRGVWDLDRLGYGLFSLPLGREAESSSLEFLLPPDAKQPHSRETDELNYLIRAKFAIVLQKDTGSGQLILRAMTNGCTSVQITIKVRRADGAHPEVEWSTVGLIRGVEGKVEKSVSFQVGLTNYLPYCGVRGGRNPLTFQAERLGGVKVADVSVLPSSAIIVTPASPSHLVLEPDTVDREPAMGRTLVLPVRIRNAGDRVANGVGLGISSSSPLLDVISATQVTLGSIGRQAKTVRIRLKPQATGNYRIGLQATSSNANQPFTRIDVDVGSGDGDSDLVSWPLAVGWLFAVAGVGMLWIRHRNNR